MSDTSPPVAPERVYDEATGIYLGLVIRRGALTVVEDRMGNARSCGTLEIAMDWLRRRWADGNEEQPQ